MTKTNSKNDLAFELEKLRLEYLFENSIDLKHRIIRISGSIDESSFESFDIKMTELEKANPRKSITIRINSPGGSVYEALAIVGRIKACKCPVITEGYGHVMSSATMILSSGSKRRMSAYAIFMHHKSSYSLEGDHDSIVSAVKQAENEEQLWAEWMSSMSNKSKQYWLNSSTNKNLYLTASQLLNTGAIDEII